MNLGYMLSGKNQNSFFTKQKLFYREGFQK